MSKVCSSLLWTIPNSSEICTVAYKLDLPLEAKIHHTFHFSLLKKKIGNVPVFLALPTATNHRGQPLVEPIAILEQRMVKRGNHATTQVLVQWSNSFVEDAT